MPYENFTTYTEVDPNNRFAVSANDIAVTGLTRNENAYVYKDKGIDHFNGDFAHLVDVIYTSVTGTDVVVCWGLWNTVGTLNQVWTGSGIVVHRNETAGVSATVTLREADGGVAYTSTYADTLSPQNRYYKIIRDESVGTYGTIYLYIYSDAARTNLLSTLSIALHTSKKDFRYIYAAQSYNDANASTFTGSIKNLDLQVLLQGTVDAISAAEGFARGLKRLSGGVNGISSSEAYARVRKQIAGNVQGLSLSDAFAKVLRALKGDVSGVSTAEAYARVLRRLSGDVSGVSTAEAYARVLRRLSGDVSGISSTEAYARAIRRLVGSVQGLSTVEAEVFMQIAMSDISMKQSKADGVTLKQSGFTDLKIYL